jgi:membrane protease YdiL (CAAX protease family)
MDYPSGHEDPIRKSWIDRIQAAFEVLLMSGLLSSFLAGLPLALLGGNSAELLENDAKLISFFVLLEAGFAFLILFMVLRVRRENLKNLGLEWARWKPNLIIGLTLVPFLFLINILVAVVFRLYLPAYYIEQNPLTEVIHTPQQLILFIFSALIAGGIKEELQRAFILNRFRRYLGGSAVGLLVWSLAFGAGHYVQGWQGVLIATIFGFVFGLVYIMSGNLIAPIVAHGTYDTIALLGYWFSSGKGLS